MPFFRWSRSLSAVGLRFSFSLTELSASVLVSRADRGEGKSHRRRLGRHINVRSQGHSDRSLSLIDALDLAPLCSPATMTAAPRRCCCCCCCDPATMRVLPLETKREIALLLLPAAAAVRASRSMKKRKDEGRRKKVRGRKKLSLPLPLARFSLLRHKKEEKEKKGVERSSSLRCTLDRHALVVVTFHSFQSFALDMHSSALARRGGARMASKPSTSPSLSSSSSSSMSSVACRRASSPLLLLANR